MCDSQLAAVYRKRTGRSAEHRLGTPGHSREDVKRILTVKCEEKKQRAKKRLTMREKMKQTFPSFCFSRRSKPTGNRVKPAPEPM